MILEGEVRQEYFLGLLVKVTVQRNDPYLQQHAYNKRNSEICKNCLSCPSASVGQLKKSTF